MYSTGKKDGRRKEKVLCDSWGTLPSFPGSHTPEREHWSCAGVESLVFFVMWKAPKVERRYRELNCTWAYLRCTTEKRAKVVGNLLHISSYLGSNNIHTERWSIIGWTTRKMLPFCLVLFWLCHAYIEKIPGSPHDTYSRSRRAWERG